MESNTQQPNQPKGSNRKTAAIVGILVGIAAVLVVVNGMLKKDKPVDKGNVVAGNVNSTTNQNANTPTNTNQSTVIDNTDRPLEVITLNVDTSEWKMYRNTKYGFQLRLPKELKNVYPSDAASHEGQIPFDEDEHTYWFLWSPNNIFDATVKGVMKVDFEFLAEDEKKFDKDIEIEYANTIIRVSQYKKMMSVDNVEVYQPINTSKDDCSGYIVRNVNAIAFVQFCELAQNIISSILQQFTSLER